MNKTVNEVVVLYTSTVEIKRPMPDHKYAAMLLLPVTALAPLPLV